jgi:integrase
VIRKRGGVYWYRIKITRTEADGERQEYCVERSAHTNRRREAEGLEREHRRALRLGQVHPLDPWPPAAPPQAPTLKDFEKRFLEHAEQHCKPRTAQFYRDCLRRVLAFHPLAEIPMSQATGELVGKYVRFRQGLPSGNSVAALNGEMRTLRCAFRLAEEWGLISKAPTIHELPGKVNRERVVSFEEERLYLAAASGTVRDMATLAVDTGLRPNSELFPLLWENVHLAPSDEGMHGFLHVAEGKTPSAIRNVPLTPRARAILEMRRSRKRGSLYVFPGPGLSGHITTVQHAHERTIRRVNEPGRKRAREKAENEAAPVRAKEKPLIEPFEFYCWRHTCGTRWAESGMDKFTVARLMGHSSPRVAERYYIHVTVPHVTTGFERFVTYLERQLVDSVPAASTRVQ